MSEVAIYPRSVEWAHTLPPEAIRRSLGPVGVNDGPLAIECIAVVASVVTAPILSFQTLTVQYSCASLMRNCPPHMTTVGP